MWKKCEGLVFWCFPCLTLCFSFAALPFYWCFLLICIRLVRAVCFRNANCTIISQIFVPFNRNKVVKHLWRETRDRTFSRRIDCNWFYQTVYLLLHCLIHRAADRKIWTTNNNLQIYIYIYIKHFKKQIVDTDASVKIKIALIFCGVTHSMSLIW